jgi:hypothetical protein
MISRSRYLRLALALALALGVGSGACAPAKTTAKAPPRFGKVDEKPTKQPWMQGKQSVGEAEVLTVESGVAGDRISSLLEVPETDCAVVIARATPSVDDVDLFAYGEDGAVLGSDEGSDKQPALLVCPPHPRRIFLAARIAAGHGLVALGAQRVHVRDAERVAKAYGVRYRPGELARRMSVWPGLDEQLEQHRRTLGGSWVDLRRVAVPLDARTPTRLSATVDAERCLDLLVVPSDEIVALDVTLLDAEGRIVGRARGGGRDRSLVVCSPTPSAVTFELRPHVGIGLAIAMMSRSREGTEADIDADVTRLDLYPTQGVGPERERRAAELTRLGLPGGRLVTTGTLPLGQRKSVSFELPAGCSRLDLVAGTPLRGRRLAARELERPEPGALRLRGRRTRAPRCGIALSPGAVRARAASGARDPEGTRRASAGGEPAARAHGRARCDCDGSSRRRRVRASRRAERARAPDPLGSRRALPRRDGCDRSGCVGIRDPSGLKRQSANRAR